MREGNGEREREKRDGKRRERETGLAEEPQLFNYHFLTTPLPGMVPRHTWLLILCAHKIFLINYITEYH